MAITAANRPLSSGLPDLKGNESEAKGETYRKHGIPPQHVGDFAGSRRAAERDGFINHAEKGRPFFEAAKRLFQPQPLCFGVGFELDEIAHGSAFLLTGLSCDKSRASRGGTILALRNLARP